MKSHHSQKLAGFCFFSLVLSLSFSSAALAGRAAAHETVSDGQGEETSAAQAQATMASLFGRGAKMPGIPQIKGTIALPAFDKPGMQIDESALRLAQEGQRSSKKTEREL